MNKRFKETPELIGRIELLNAECETNYLGNRVVGIQVIKKGSEPVAQLDVRSFKGGNNLIVEIELGELVAALSQATLHAEE